MLNTWLGYFGVYIYLLTCQIQAGSMPKLCQEVFNYEWKVPKCFFSGQVYHQTFNPIVNLLHLNINTNNFFFFCLLAYLFHVKNRWKCYTHSTVFSLNLRCGGGMFYHIICVHIKLSFSDCMLIFQNVTKCSL